MIKLEDDAQAVEKIGPPKPNTKWLGHEDDMPSRKEQDRLDAETENDTDDDS